MVGVLRLRAEEEEVNNISDSSRAGCGPAPDCVPVFADTEVRPGRPESLTYIEAAFLGVCWLAR